MKQSSNSRRGRGRGNNGKRSQNRSNNFDSNGPEGRIRGNASQVYEKYLALARDALSSDDRISSENYFQHAEHFFRIMSSNAETQSQKDAQKSTTDSEQKKDQTLDLDGTKQSAKANNHKDRNKNRRGRNNNSESKQEAVETEKDQPGEKTVIKQAEETENVVKDVAS